MDDVMSKRLTLKGKKHSKGSVINGPGMALRQVLDERSIKNLKISVE